MFCSEINLQIKITDRNCVTYENTSKKFILLNDNLIELHELSNKQNTIILWVDAEQDYHGVV